MVVYGRFRFKLTCFESVEDPGSRWRSPPVRWLLGNAMPAVGVYHRGLHYARTTSNLLVRVVALVVPCGWVAIPVHWLTKTDRVVVLGRQSASLP